MKTNRQRVTLLVFCILFLTLMIVSVVTTNNRINETDDKLTSVDVIHAFFNSLIDGDVEKLNAKFVAQYFDNTDTKNGYSEFPKQKITDIQIKLLDKSTDKDKFYEVVFTITDNSAPPFIIAGSGEKTYFFNLIMEDENWKIKVIATSP